MAAVGNFKRKRLYVWKMSLFGTKTASAVASDFEKIIGYHQF